MEEKANILEVMQSPDFPEVLMEEFLIYISNKTGMGRVLGFFEGHRDLLYPAMLNYVECELLGSTFKMVGGLTKSDLTPLHNNVLLPAVGLYLDRQRGIEQKPRKIANTIKKYE